MPRYPGVAAASGAVTMPVGFPQVSRTTQQFATAAQAHLVQMPATVDAGDLLAVAICFKGTATLDGGGPSGWTQKHSYTIAGSQASYVFVKDAVGDEDGTTVDFNTNLSFTAAAQIFRITDWSGDIADVIAGTPVEESGSVNTGNPPSVTTGGAAAKNLFIELIFLSDDEETIGSFSSNYTNGASTVAGAGANAGVTVATAWRELEAASDDPGTVTIAGGATEFFVSNTIVVQPV
jgi:hypothetical protein